MRLEAVAIAIAVLAGCHRHRGAESPTSDGDVHISDIGNGQVMIRVDADDAEDEAPALESAYRAANRRCPGGYGVVERLVGSTGEGDTRCGAARVGEAVIANCRIKRGGHDVTLIVECRAPSIPDR